MGITLVGVMVTCAPAETRTTYPKTFFRSKSTSSYSAKSTADYEPISAVTYEPSGPSVTTVAPAYKAATTVPATTYRPAIAPQVKAEIVAPYAKNTFFKSKSAVTIDKSTGAYKPAMGAPAATVSNPSVNPSSETNVPLVPAEKVKGGSYVNTFFKKKPKTSVESATNSKKATTGAITSQTQSVISQVKISEPVNEGDVKTTKKKSYTNTYFKAKPAIVSTQVPTLDKHAVQLSSNDSLSEESSEESHGSDGTSQSSEESSEEDGEGTSEEEGEEEEEASVEEKEGEEEKDAEADEDEEEESKKEDNKEDNKAVKDEESKDQIDVKSIQKTNVVLSTPTPVVKSVHIDHEKKNTKPVFLAFKKMRSKPITA